MRSAGSDRPFRPIEVTLEEVDGSFDKMFRRFIRRTKDDGILADVQSRRAFKKPSEVRRAAKRAPR